MDKISDKTFSVIIENTLTDYDRKTLSKLYLPIIGPQALSLYDYLFVLEVPGSKESKTLAFKELFDALGLNETNFIKNMDKLEGIGLVDTYLLNNNYVFVVKKVLSAYEFFMNQDLARILELKVGCENALHLSYEMLVRRNDLHNYQNISKRFDEVYDIVDYDMVNNYAGLGVDTINNGIRILNSKFDYERFLLLIEGKGVLDKEVIESAEFKNLIMRDAFFYEICVADMFEAVMKSLNAGNIDKDHLLYEVVSIYDKKHAPQTVVAASDVVGDNKTVILLETKSPNEIYMSYAGTRLIGSEIRMFDQLLEETGLPLGVLNACLIYIIKTKGVKLPGHNYFHKVLTSWKRDGIVTTAAALNYLATPSEKSKNKTVKPVPKWYNEQKEENIEQTNETVSEEDIKELERFFGRGNDGK